MAFNISYPTANPRLGTSFGIFTSAFASLVLILIILEQLGLERGWISHLIVAMPVLFYAGIGLFVRTTSIEDFFTAGYRVPPFYNGVALSSNLISGAGLVGVIGSFFFIGYDALPMILGWCAGLGVMSVIFAPYLRKAGAYTLPGFFGIRFASRTVRLIAALLVFPPVLILLAAELRIGQLIAGVFIDADPAIALQVGAALMTLAVIFGGMRSLTWTQCAQFIVTLLGLSVPLIVISLLITNLPVPQLSFGSVLQGITELEATRDVVNGQTAPLGQALPTSEPSQLSQPFVAIFETLGAGDFLALTLCLMLGTAVLPAQIARVSTSPNVAAIRKSFGWAAVLVGLVALTIPAYAAFAKYQALSDLLGLPAAQIPDWGTLLSQLNLVTLTANTLDPALGGANVDFGRDSVIFVLPIMNEFPFVMVGLVGAAALAAVLAAAGGQIVTLGAVLSNDIYYSFNRSASPARRLLIARLAMIGFVIGAYFIAIQDNVDPLRLILWAISLCAGAYFAPLAMAIWWKGLTGIGAIFGMLAGFAVTAAYINTTMNGGGEWFDIDGLTAGLIGIPISAGIAFAVSVVTPRPDSTLLDIVDEMHVPSGETVYARLMRLAARGKGPKP